MLTWNFHDSRIATVIRDKEPYGVSLLKHGISSNYVDFTVCVLHISRSLGFRRTVRRAETDEKTESV